jgi:glucose-6-phosphate 1-dehydrogenase
MTMTDDALIPEPHVVVLFGATGDLARKKVLPALYHLTEEGLMPGAFRIVGVSLEEMSEEGFREFVREALEEFSPQDVPTASWDRFAPNLTYAGGEFSGGSSEGGLPDAVRVAEEAIGGSPRRLFYLAVPPSAFAPITEALGACGLSTRARVIFEKPFGKDVASFEELNRRVHEVLDESQAYRIDHYLGKETVQNILAFRFANGMFEPIWHRDHIEHVQIDVSESIGIGSRAGFYEHTGAMRDMVVTHLFQVLSFVALEPPTEVTPQTLSDEKLKVFQSMLPLDREHVVRGQYDGYRDEEDVAPDSDTETFFAARLFIDNWRWAGVPFFLRTGKCMAERRSSVTLAFRDPPRKMFEDVEVGDFGRDHLTLELGPDEGISMTFLAKVPGPTIRFGRAEMNFRYAGSFGSELIEAYERLIHDALIGDGTLFTGDEDIRRAWEIVDPVLQDPPSVHFYPQGSWGPPAANELVRPGRWNSPGEARDSGGT